MGTCGTLPRVLRMSIAIEGVPRRNVCVSLDEEVYKLFRGVLFRNAVTMQEFVNYVIEVGVKQDKRVMTLLNETKVKKSQMNVDDFLKGKQTTTASELYNLLEQGSAANRQRKVEDDNEDDKDNNCWYDEKGNAITWGRESDKEDSLD